MLACLVLKYAAKLPIIFFHANDFYGSRDAINRTPTIPELFQQQKAKEHFKIGNSIQSRTFIGIKTS